jgi:hypothetical protein
MARRLLGWPARQFVEPPVEFTQMCGFWATFSGPARSTAGQKKARSGLQSACDELIDKGAIHQR